jgi:uncharacterized protein
MHQFLRIEHADRQSLVEGISALVQDFLKNESSGHDWEHIRRVWSLAKTIATQEQANGLLVELAALLHDIDDWKITGKSMGEEPENAALFLREVGAEDTLIRDVCAIIKSIDYRGSITASKLVSLEDKIVHDADKLDAIGAIGIGRCFALEDVLLSVENSERPCFCLTSRLSPILTKRVIRT